MVASDIVSQRHKLNRHKSSQPAWQAFKGEGEGEGEGEGGIWTPATQASLFQSPCALIKAFGASWQKANRTSSTKTMRAVGSRFDADRVKQHFNNSIILLVSQDRPVNALQYK